MLAYDRVVLGSWLAFLLVWAALAHFVKRDVRGGVGASLWWRYSMLRFVLVAVLIIAALRWSRGAPPPTAARRMALFSPPLAVAWIGAALTAIGIAVAISARLYLGRNWSPTPAMKEHHELVTTGPYTYVRHPIYSGIGLAALGSALTGTIFALVVLVVVGIVFLSRIGREERIMLTLFPAEYPAYQARTKRIIPFVW